MKQLTKDVQKVQFKESRKLKVFGTKIAIPPGLTQKIMLLLSIFALFMGWGSLLINQNRAIYHQAECQRFEVKFDPRSFDFFRDTCQQNNTIHNCADSWTIRQDQIDYSSFNDVYEAEENDDGSIKLVDYRPVYNQRDKTGFNAFGEDSPGGKFRYCHEEEAWVFVIDRVSKSEVDVEDGGCNWLMKSPKTKAFTLHEVELDGWVMWTGILHVMQSFSISCLECSGEIDKPSADCTYHGKCSNKKCVCDSNWTGSQCESCASCSRLELTLGNETRSSGFKRLDNGNFKTIEVYGRPVYYKVDIFDNPDPALRFISYTGRRYAMYDLSGKMSLSTTIATDLRKFFKTFHSTWDLEPNMIRMVSEETDLPMPFGLKWARDFGATDEDDFFKVDLTCPFEEERKKCQFVFNNY